MSLLCNRRIDWIKDVSLLQINPFSFIHHYCVFMETH